MRRLKIQLEPPEIKEIENQYRREKDVRSKMRLLSLKLAMEGKHTGKEIAGICGCSRASLFGWIKEFRTEGINGLIRRGKPGPQKGEMRGISEALCEQIKKGVEEGKWATAEEARQWLQREHGIKKPYVTVWQWIKKLEECCAFRGPGTLDKTPQRQKYSKRHSA